MRQPFSTTNKKKKGKGRIKCSSIMFVILSVTFVWYSFSSHQVLLQNATPTETKSEGGTAHQGGEGRLAVLKRDLELATEQMNTLLERLNNSPVFSENSPHQDSIIATALQEAITPTISQPLSPIQPISQPMNQAPQYPVTLSIEKTEQYSTDGRAASSQSSSPIVGGGMDDDRIRQSRNPILFMSDEQLHSTPFDQLLALYGPDTVAGNAHHKQVLSGGGGGGRDLLSRGKNRGGSGGGGGGGGGGCDYDFGVKLANRWRSTAKECCHPIKPTDHINGTRFTCHKIQQTRHHGDGDQLWLGENVRLNFGDLANNEGSIPKKYFREYVKTKHNQAHSKIKWSAGTVAGMCEPDPSQGWNSNEFPGWNVDFFNAFTPLGSGKGGGTRGGGGKSLQCDIWVEEPTLIVERDTFANFFHNSEDFFNTFLSLAILKWPLDNLQIILTDIFPRGPFWPMWSKVFQAGKPHSPRPIMAHDIPKLYGNKNVCFKKLAFGILGAAAPMTVASWDTDCHNVALVRAYADYVVRKLELHRLNEGRSARDVNITYTARRASVEWPEKAFCDSENSYFDCSQLNHLQIRKLGRMIRNDKEILPALKRLESQTFPNGARVNVREVDFSVLSLEDQIAVDVTTDIMIGPHGAGLMHNIFMPTRAALMELFVDGSSANRHFHNLAFWAGHSYKGESQNNPINIPKLVQQVSSLVAGLDLSNKPW